MRAIKGQDKRNGGTGTHYGLASPFPPPEAGEATGLCSSTGVLTLGLLDWSCLAS